MSKTKKTKIKRTVLNGSTTNITNKHNNLINLIGLIVLSAALITAVIIMVCCFSIKVEVVNPNTQNNTTQTDTKKEQEYNSDVSNNTDTNVTPTIQPVSTETEQEKEEEVPTPSGTGEIVPTEEEEQKPVPSEEPASSKPSEEDSPKVNPKEEDETDPVEEEPAPEPIMIIDSTLKIKIIIDNIKGRPTTKYYELSSTEGNTIGYEDILAFVDEQLLNDYGYYMMEKVDGPQESYTFTSEDAMYSTVFTVMVRR